MQRWSRENPLTDATDDIDITEKSGIQMYQYYRNVCSWRLVQHDPQIVLGGADESLFCHKVKVCNNTLFHFNQIN